MGEEEAEKVYAKSGRLAACCPKLSIFALKLTYDDAQKTNLVV